MTCPYLIGSGIKSYRCSVLTEKNKKEYSCVYQRYCSGVKQYITTDGQDDCIFRKEREQQK